MNNNSAVPPGVLPVLPGFPMLLHPPMNLNHNSPINVLRPIQPLSLPARIQPQPVNIPQLNPYPVPPTSNNLTPIVARPTPNNNISTPILMPDGSTVTISTEGPLPEMTSMELSTVMGKLKKDLRTKKGFNPACALVTRLIPKFLNSETKRLFYDALNIASFRIGKPGFSVAAAKPMFQVAYDHREHLTPGYRKNVEEWKAAVDKMSDNPLASTAVVPQSSSTAGRFGNAPVRRSAGHHRNGISHMLQSLLSSMRGDEDSDSENNGRCACGQHHGHASSDSDDTNVPLQAILASRNPLEMFFGNHNQFQMPSDKKSDGVGVSEYPYCEYEATILPPFKVFQRQENQMLLPFVVPNEVLTKMRADPTGYQLRLCCVDDVTPNRNVRAPAVLLFQINSTELNMNFLNGVDEILGIDITARATKPVNNLTISRYSNWGFFGNLSFSIKLTKVIPIDALKERILKEKTLPYQVCFDKVSKSFQGDGDIMEVSLKFSLRCPLSLMRIEVPIKGKDCKHIQCFDANSYLQINKNHPKFDCPVCNKKVYFSSLVVDSYFLKILGEVQNQPDVDEVLILPDGTYNIIPPKEEKDSDEDSYSESVGRKRKIDQIVAQTSEPNKRQSKAYVLILLQKDCDE